MELEEAKWYSHISRLVPLRFLWEIRFVSPHKEITCSFLIPCLISEARREWHEEKTRMRTTKTNRQMIFFFSISFHLLLTVDDHQYILFLFSFHLPWARARPVPCPAKGGTHGLHAEVPARPAGGRFSTQAWFSA
jgi:hypothetical protein